MANLLSAHASPIQHANGKKRFTHVRYHQPVNCTLTNIYPIVTRSLGGEYAMSTIQSSAASHSLLPCQRTQQTNNKSQGEIEIIARTLKSLAAH